MPRKRESLKYALNKRAFQNTKNSKNNNTETSYKRSINQFVEWAKKRGYKTADEVTKETIQEYEEFLEGHPKSYQPSTIHTFLTPICVATGVSMGEIRKPKRTAGKIVRSRNKALMINVKTRRDLGRSVIQNMHGSSHSKERLASAGRSLQSFAGRTWTFVTVTALSLSGAVREEKDRSSIYFLKTSI